MAIKPVIVYGASGYTGRLVCEYLREYNVPFVAARRDESRLKTSMESGKLGYGVRVNCIYPGLVPTAMGAGLANDVARIGLFGSPEEAVGAVIELTPAGRLGTVEDMADAVVFLASDASRFVHGVGLPVDGGMGM